MELYRRKAYLEKQLRHFELKLKKYEEGGEQSAGEDEEEAEERAGLFKMIFESEESGGEGSDRSMGGGINFIGRGEGE